MFSSHWVLGDDGESHRVTGEIHNHLYCLSEHLAPSCSVQTRWSCLWSMSQRRFSAASRAASCQLNSWTFFNFWGDTLRITCQTTTGNQWVARESKRKGYIPTIFHCSVSKLCPSFDTFSFVIVPQCFSVRSGPQRVNQRWLVYDGWFRMLFCWMLTRFLWILNMFKYQIICFPVSFYLPQ